MNAARWVSALIVAVALSPAAAPAATPQADEVVVTTAGWMVRANSRGYTLRFTRNGDAVYDGHLRGYDGHYVAKADFVAVEAEVEHAKLCERPGIRLFIPAGARPMAGPAFLVQVRCGRQVKVFNDDVLAELPAFAQALLAVGKDLPWQRSGPAQRESLVHFIR